MTSALTMSDDPWTLLVRLKRGQGGAFTRAQARAAGYHPVEIAALVRRGQWLVLERGVYVEARTMRPGDPHGQHALRVAARSLAFGGRHTASRRSASLVLGLPLLGAVPFPPEVTRHPRKASDRSSSSTVRVAPLPAQDVVRWRDVDSTAPARLVCDLARTHGQVEALMVADAALRAGLDAALLRDTALRCAPWPGGAAIAEVVAAADRRTDSPLESLTRWVLRRLGIPEALSQVDVGHHGRFLGRGDVAWPELGVVLEADGMGKYDDGVLVAEKRRELNLRRAGLEVVRSTWDDAWSRPQLISSEWHTHVALAAGRADQRGHTQLRPALLEVTGQRGIPFPSQAARPLSDRA